MFSLAILTLMTSFTSYTIMFLLPCGKQVILPLFYLNAFILFECLYSLYLCCPITNEEDKLSQVEAPAAAGLKHDRRLYSKVIETKDY